MTNPRHGRHRQTSSRPASSPALSPYLLEDVGMTPAELEVARISGPEIVGTR